DLAPRHPAGARPPELLRETLLHAEDHGREHDGLPGEDLRVPAGQGDVVPVREPGEVGIRAPHDLLRPVERPGVLEPKLQPGGAPRRRGGRGGAGGERGPPAGVAGGSGRAGGGGPPPPPPPVHAARSSAATAHSAPPLLRTPPPRMPSPQLWSESSLAPVLL